MSDAKVVTIKPRAWERGVRERTVTLTPDKHMTDEWSVAAGGEDIGTVTRYTGTLDRPTGPGNRLRHQGKRRTLWAYRGPDSRITMWDQYSRADCLRSLLADHERRVRASS